MEKPTSRGHWCHKDERCKQWPCCSPVQEDILFKIVSIDLKILKILRRKGWGNYVWFYLSGEKKRKKNILYLCIFHLQDSKIICDIIYFHLPDVKFHATGSIVTSSGVLRAP